MNKIILSRKGYDDQYGGKPSPILPDGTMLSFPIPLSDTKEEGLYSGELIFKNKSLSEYFSALGHKETNRRHHVDPDIYGFSGKQSMGTFGQAGAALGHLDNQNVGKGDIFLFFGTFCKTTILTNGLQYEKMHPVHALFGYLFVERRVTMDEIDNEPELFWLKAHPHYRNRHLGDYAKANAIYIGGDCGYFRFSNRLQLTKPGYLKSFWELPVAFANIKMTYHEKVEKQLSSDRVAFTSVAKGQEFVFEHTAEIEPWLRDVLGHGG
jgi:hypothetical protein